MSPEAVTLDVVPVIELSISVRIIFAEIPAATATFSAPAPPAETAVIELLSLAETIMLDFKLTAFPIESVESMILA